MTTPNTEIKSEETHPSNAFAMLLQDQRDGDCLRDLSEKLNDLVLKMRDRLRPGELILRLKFQPASAAKVVTITDEITVKLPKEDKEGTLMFTTEEGTLTRKNPEQKELNLREVPKATAPLKDVTADQEEEALRAAGAD